ncbi:hypothetical protein BC939DRAFT_444522 [Gamsiella multidivaricata]|uniref:uncharacterized protein n=1 Tax=Gamsiella multidivaricata TaxID=101098 RepID=UPI00221E6AA1|nr:uncharacterized protein BC939DRAFT_444522 [Gamsiella multidivaricata]KAI7828094.1 hypothetical protein BC939DRAFT_444522 [Gamsiella multidivaricata]
MTTDDETSSAASFRQRPRKLSKAGSVPSPLGDTSSFSSIRDGTSNTLSAFSFLSSGEKGTSSANVPDVNGVSPSQLRVRHLERDSAYAGYLTKFSSRTFFSRKQWKRRYFILHEQSLYCFKSSDPQHPLLESLVLSPEAIICVTDIFSGKRYCLQISCPGEKSWYVLADTASEMSGWLKELKNTVHRVRNLQTDGQGTIYSGFSEITETSGTSATARVPSVPAIPSQYGHMHRDSRFMAGALSATSMPPLHGQTSSYSQHQDIDFYQGQVTSLNPPPRSITPKPSTPTPGSGPQRPQGSSQGHSYGTSAPEQPQQFLQPEIKRRRNSSLSSGQHVSDYASFGSVMERADAMADAQKGVPSSSWTIPAKSERSDINYATIPRSKRESTISTMTGMSNMSSFPNNHRTSMISEQSEYTVSLPHRSVQKQAGISPRPMSPVSSRPLSPSLTRSSPRSSLVISPPPRSVHRPASVSIRHSTQILPPPQILTAGLPSQQPLPSSPFTSNPPTSSLPATPESGGDQSANGSLSRITSIRHQRDPGLNRHSMISVVSTSAKSVGGTGSIQERVQRSSSRTNAMRSGLPSTGGPPLKPATATDLLGMNRPLSPTPSLASAPTLPLPEPPRTSSPSKAGSSPRSVSSSSSSSSATQPTEASRRLSSIPHHHEPDLPIPNRSKARIRSQSQEAALISAKLGDLQLSRRATTPSPRLSAVLTSSKENTSAGSGEENGKSSSKGSKGSSAHSRQLSLPIHAMYVLPAPPIGQAPVQPPASASSSRPLLQRPSGSSSALRPISSSMNNVASLGGGIARKSSTSNSASGSKRDSTLNTRLSALISLPPGPTTAVPLPPKASLPAPPTSALPKKPTSANTSNTKSGPANAQTGFGAILEEEEDDEEDDDEDDGDEEYVSRLQFEELEAARAAAEQGLDPDSNVTTPTTAAPREYYATKESKVVEYIFPSESFTA